MIISWPRERKEQEQGAMSKRGPQTKSSSYTSFWCNVVGEDFREAVSGEFIVLSISLMEDVFYFSCFRILTNSFIFGSLNLYV